MLMYVIMSEFVVQVANSVAHDQTPHSVASNLGIHCLFISVWPST